MNRLGPAALLLLAACASKAPMEPPTIRSVPPALIADSGASLYIIKCAADWLDDTSDDLFQRVPDEGDDLPVGPKASSHTQWLGEWALDLILRHGLSQREATFFGHADFQPFSGIPIEVTLFNPDTESRPEQGKRTGFHVRLKASPSDKKNYLAVEWQAERLTDGPATDPDAARRGEFPRVRKSIGGGACILPIRASLMMYSPTDKKEGYLMLLRVTSLRDP